MIKKDIRTLVWIFNKTKSSLPLVGITALLSAIMSGISVYSAIISKSLIDASTSGNMNSVMKWLMIMGGVFFLQTTINSMNSLVSTYSSTRLFQSLQKQLYEKITNSEWIELSKYHSANLLTRLNSDVKVVSHLITSTLVSIVSLGVTLGTAFLTLFYLDKNIAIYTIIFAPLFIILSRFYGRKVKHIYHEAQDLNIKYTSFIQESIQNLMIIKAFCHEDKNFESLNVLQQERLNLNLKSTKFKLSSNVLFQVLSYILYFFIFGTSVIKLTRGLITFGTLTATLQLYNRVSGPISGLAGVLPSIIRSIAAAERLIEIENFTSESNKSELVVIVKPTIEFKNVSFQYSKKEAVLQNLSFKINPGEIVGLIGPSGSGKTTVIKLLLSLLHPDSGDILISNQDGVYSLNNQHRNLISYVPQGNTLFSGTIRENISFGVNEANEKQIIRAAKQACAWEFIQNLDYQLDTIIGEKGLGLSEGQAQRIAIARAFLKLSPILILDEATSALDETTELKIINEVHRLSHRPTCLIITHRPIALEICDRVFSLNQNKLSDFKTKAV